MAEYIVIFLIIIFFTFFQVLFLEKIKVLFLKKGIGIDENEIGDAWGVVLLNFKNKKSFFSQIMIFLLEILINFVWFAFNFSLLFLVFYFFHKIYTNLV